jgi:hypothetical protein
MSPRERSLLARLDPDAYMVEIAALLDVLGVEHDTVCLGLPRSMAALFAQDLRSGQAARGVVRSSPDQTFLPDDIEATIRNRAGVRLQVPGWIARAIACDLEVGRRIRLGLPALSRTPRPIAAGRERSTSTTRHDRLSRPT